MAMSIPIFSQTNNNGNINSNCFETQYQWQWQYQFLFKPISMAIPIAIVVPRQYQWQYQYQLFSSAISMSMAISIVSIALSQYQCSINQYLSKLININGNVNCSKNTLSIVNGNNNTSKIVNTNGCQYYCSCLQPNPENGNVRDYALLLLNLKWGIILKLLMRAFSWHP